MKRIVRVVAPAVAIAALAAPASAGGPVEIEFGDNFFAPANPPALGVSDLGEEAAWVGPDADLRHNIHQDDRLFRSGDPSAVLAEYREDISAGKYHYYCQVHGSKAGGMDGVIRVRPEIRDASEKSVLVAWADEEVEPRHRFEVQFRVEGRKWKTWKRGTKQADGQFGAGDKPVNLVLGRFYEVRARTFVKRHRDRRSGWSPALGFAVNS